MKLKTISFKTQYWRPGTDYITKIIDTINTHIQDDDVLTISEKALSIASGQIIDEETINPGKLARLLVDPWTIKIWAGPLGKLVGLKDQTRRNLKGYPVEEGAAHKQLALVTVGLLQSLRHYSEGGIDASNLPYSYVSLPLKDPLIVASCIMDEIFQRTGKRVTVIIVDGDTTYSWRNLHLAPRKVSVPGLVHFGGVFTFLVGRILGFKSRQTPIAVSGRRINPDRALWFARLFHRLCGAGAGRTVWSMSSNLETSLTGVTWEMLDQVDHFPLMIIRQLE